MKSYFDKKKIKEYLERFDKLKYFSDEILKSFKINEYEPNEFIFFSGMKLTEVKFLIDGTVFTTHFNEKGQESLMCLTNNFEIYGDLELCLDIQNIKLNVQSKSKCILLSVSVDKIKREFKKSTLMYKMFNKTLAKKLNTIGNSFAGITNLSLEERYKELMNTFFNNPQIKKSLTQKDIAKLLGVSDRHLRRVINKNY